MLFSGSLYTNEYFKFFSDLDYSNIFHWLMNNMVDKFFLVWWIIGLFITVTFIMINTFFCTVKKLYTLCTKRGLISTKQLIGKYCISIIHIFTITILMAHGISHGFSKTYTFPIEEGKSIKPGNNQNLYIEKILITYYPKRSLFINCIKDIKLTMVECGDVKKRITISPLNPVLYKDYTLFVIQNKKKNKQNAPSPMTNNFNEVKFYLLARKDSGYTLWVLSFTVIIVLMSLYYWLIYKEN